MFNQVKSVLNRKVTEEECAAYTSLYAKIERYTPELQLYLCVKDCFPLQGSADHEVNLIHTVNNS